MKNIEVSKIIDPIPASDGAGVKLKRSIGVEPNYFNFMIQKATELGVTKFLPIIFERTASFKFLFFNDFKTSGTSLNGDRIL